MVWVDIDRHRAQDAKCDATCRTRRQRESKRGIPLDERGNQATGKRPGPCLCSSLISSRPIGSLFFFWLASPAFGSPLRSWSLSNSLVERLGKGARANQFPPQVRSAFRNRPWRFENFLRGLGLAAPYFAALGVCCQILNSFRMYDTTVHINSVLLVRDRLSNSVIVCIPFHLGN